MTIELSDKVLCSVTAERTSGVDVAHQHPLLLSSATNGQLHHVGALPYTTMVTVFATEAALHSPILEVWR